MILFFLTGDRSKQNVRNSPEKGLPAEELDDVDPRSRGSTLLMNGIGHHPVYQQNSSPETDDNDDHMTIRRRGVGGGGGSGASSNKSTPILHSYYRSQQSTPHSPHSPQQQQQQQQRHPEQYSPTFSAVDSFNTPTGYDGYNNSSNLPAHIRRSGVPVLPSQLNQYLYNPPAPPRPPPIVIPTSNLTQENGLPSPPASIITNSNPLSPTPSLQKATEV